MQDLGVRVGLKLTTHDYFKIAIYFVQLIFNAYMFYAGLVGAVKPLLFGVIWLIVWGLMFAYAVSIIGRAMDDADKREND